MNESVPALEYRKVCFAYEREEVLHNVSLQIPMRSLVAMVGPNGGGKSTLIKLALGLIRPGRGEVSVFGATPVQSRARIGYVPQHLQFDPAFPVSVMDVVLMGRAERHIIGPYRQRDRDRAAQVLERVQLAKFARREFSRLSGGERQRVLIAQALVSDPDLMLLDEPTANVDPTVEHQLNELLNRLRQEITIVMVSHNLSVVTRHATHVACVNRTASVLPMGSLSDAELHAVYQGDMAVLQHKATCHVIDPSAAMQQSHEADLITEGGA
jgi:zinc transport system ATP-binding protein